MREHVTHQELPFLKLRNVFDARPHRTVGAHNDGYTIIFVCDDSSVGVNGRSRVPVSVIVLAWTPPRLMLEPLSILFAVIPL